MGGPRAWCHIWLVVMVVLCLLVGGEADARSATQFQSALGRIGVEEGMSVKWEMAVVRSVEQARVDWREGGWGKGSVSGSFALNKKMLKGWEGELELTQALIASKSWATIAMQWVANLPILSCGKKYQPREQIRCSVVEASTSCVLLKDDLAIDWGDGTTECLGFEWVLSAEGTRIGDEVMLRDRQPAELDSSQWSWCDWQTIRVGKEHCVRRLEHQGSVLSGSWLGGADWWVASCHGWPTLCCHGGWRTLLTQRSGKDKSRGGQKKAGGGRGRGDRVEKGKVGNSGGRGVDASRGKAKQMGQRKSAGDATSFARSTAVEKKQGALPTLVMATVNVLTLALKKSACFSTGSPVDALRLWLQQFQQHKVHIVGFQECRVVGTVDLDQVGGYKCWFSGGKYRRRGVGIAVQLFLEPYVTQVHYINDRLMAVCFEFVGARLTVVVAYAPAHRQGLVEGETHLQEVDRFWKKVKHTLEHVLPREYQKNVVMLGDFNVQLGSGVDIGSPFAEVLGGALGTVEPDPAATTLLNFCVKHGFQVADSFYGDFQAGISTWTSRMFFGGMVARGGVENCPELKSRGAIDHVLVRGDIEHTWCGVDTRFDTTHLTDHRVVRLDTTMPSPPQVLRVGASDPLVKQRPRLDWRSISKPGLVRDKARLMLRQQFAKMAQMGSEVFLYAELRARIFEVCASVLPVIAKVSKKLSPDWFSTNEDLITKTMAKQWRARKVAMCAPSSVDKRRRWHDSQKATLRLCRRLKGQFWTNVGNQLSLLYEKNDLEGFYRGINEACGAVHHAGVSGTVSSGGQTRMWDRDKKRRVPKEQELARWFEHFSELLNQPGTAGDYTRFLPSQREFDLELDSPFTRLELAVAIRQVKTGRATGADGLPVEFEKFLSSDAMLDELLKEFNTALDLGWVRREWKDVVISVLFKKGDRSLCDNYRGLSIINHTGKILERMVQNCLLPFALKN